MSKTLFLVCAFLFIACQPQEGRQSELESMSSATVTSLSFQKENGLDVLTAAAFLRGAIYEQHGHRPVVFVEPGYRSKTDPSYNVDSYYSDISAFVNDMNQQNSDYHWEETVSGGVFVYPTNGSFLNTVVGSFSESSTEFCTVVSKVSEQTHPVKAARSQCNLTGRTFVTRKSAVPTGVHILDNGPNGKKINVTVNGPNTRVVDIIEESIVQVGTGFSGTLKHLGPNIPPMFELFFF